MSNHHPLEPASDELRSMIDQVVERVIEHVETLPTQPSAYDPSEGPPLARSLAEGLPTDPTPFDEILELLFDRVIPVSYNTAAPGYLAYVPGGGLVHSALADLISGVVNRYVGVWFAAPGLVQLEANVVRWFCDIVGFPAEAGGVLTTGGSMANLIAVVTARRERLPEQFLNGQVYASDQTHHSMQKAAVLAGFPPGNIHSIPTDDRFCLRIDELERAIQRDRERGLTPFLVTASAGTTNTGAVDDLDAVADLAQREGLWFHADAAYGGFFNLTQRGRDMLRGLDRADSMALDPHKGFFLPYGNGSLLVRDAKTLQRAHATYADYMPPMQDEPDLVDFCQISPELSRDFRGLRVWLPVKLLGIGPFRDALDEKLELAQWAADRLREMPQVEIMAEPQLSIVAFRLRPPGLENGDTLNELNRRFIAAINEKGRVYLTGTMLGASYALRICVLSFRTHMEKMEHCMEDITASTREVLETAV